MQRWGTRSPAWTSATNLTADFGYYNAASYPVSGNVFNDLTNLGVKDDTDTGLSSVTVVLYNATGTAIIATTVTDSSGNYTFPGIPNGFYLVKVNTGTLPSTAFAQTYESDGSINNATAVVVSGAAVTGKDFGFHTYPGNISGAVCVGGSNGICDTGESKVADVTITLKGAGPDGILGTTDDTAASTTTDSSGAYSFTNLPPGLYQVIKTDPANTTSVADCDGGNPDNITVILDFGPDGITGNTDDRLVSTGRDFEIYGGADLAVTKSDGLTLVAPGQTITYTITIANQGIIPAAHVVLTDALGTGLT